MGSLSSRSSQFVNFSNYTFQKLFKTLLSEDFTVVLFVKIEIFMFISEAYAGVLIHCEFLF